MLMALFDGTVAAYEFTAAQDLIITELTGDGTPSIAHW